MKLCLYYYDDSRLNVLYFEGRIDPAYPIVTVFTRYEAKAKVLILFQYGRPPHEYSVDKKGATLADQSLPVADDWLHIGTPSVNSRNSRSSIVFQDLN